jgi:hypothetical protein
MTDAIVIRHPVTGAPLQAPTQDDHPNYRAWYASRVAYLAGHQSLSQRTQEQVAARRNRRELLKRESAGSPGTADTK